jgi:hypothetical protein
MNVTTLSLVYRDSIPYSLPEDCKRLGGKYYFHLFILECGGIMSHRNIRNFLPHYTVSCPRIPRSFNFYRLLSLKLDSTAVVRLQIDEPYKPRV